MNYANWIIIAVLSLIAGFVDSRGFLFASQIWLKGHFDPTALYKSAGFFALGLVFYWASIFFMDKVGLNAAELQTGLWFAIVIIGVALATGDFFNWQTIDKIVALLTAIGFLFLLVRNGG